MSIKNHPVVQPINSRQVDFLYSFTFPWFFMPSFDGYDSAISETARLTKEKILLNEDMQALLDIKFQRLLEHLSEKPLISITFFCPDKRKQGGSYVSISGTVKKLDLFQRILTLEDGMQIFLDDIVSIEAHV